MIAAALIEELVRDEGLRLKPYLDTAKPPRITIGVGRNLSDVGISREEAYHLLNNDLERVTADLDQYLPWWRSLTEARQRVLANLTFNMGIARLCGFHKMLRALQDGDYPTAAAELLDSQWRDDVGPERSGRLRDMLLSGVAA